MRACHRQCSRPRPLPREETGVPSQRGRLRRALYLAPRGPDRPVGFTRSVLPSLLPPCRPGPAVRRHETARGRADARRVDRPRSGFGRAGPAQAGARHRLRRSLLPSLPPASAGRSFPRRGSWRLPPSILPRHVDTPAASVQRGGNGEPDRSGSRLEGDGVAEAFRAGAVLPPRRRSAVRGHAAGCPGRAGLGVRGGGLPGPRPRRPGAAVAGRRPLNYPPPTGAAPDLGD
jgi:hypothetical protein